MAKKDGSISVLTVGQLAKLVPADTKIYFRDYGYDGYSYIPACEEEITWDVGKKIVMLNKGEDNESHLRM